MLGDCGRASFSVYAQHTSAYVGIRQHVSEYVSIRFSFSVYARTSRAQEFAESGDSDVYSERERVCVSCSVIERERVVHTIK
jgi:hypothetical protein